MSDTSPLLTDASIQLLKNEYLVEFRDATKPRRKEIVNDAIVNLLGQKNSDDRPLSKTILKKACRNSSVVICYQTLTGRCAIGCQGMAVQSRSEKRNKRQGNVPSQVECRSSRRTHQEIRSRHPVL